MSLPNISCRHNLPWMTNPIRGWFCLAVSRSSQGRSRDLGSGKKLDRIVDKKSFLSNHLETKLWCHFTTNDITSFHGTWDGIWEKATKLCTLSLTDNTSVFQELGWNFSVIWARKVLVVSVIWGRKVSPSLSVAVTWHKNQLKQEVPIHRPTWNITQYMLLVTQQFGTGFNCWRFLVLPYLCLCMCLCVLSFILVWWLTPLPWWTTMSYVNRGFRDERRVICDVWCVRCLNTLNTALAAVTLCYNHTALWQFITLGKLITGIRHTPTAEIQMDKITNV